MKKLSAVLMFFFCFTAMLFAQNLFDLAPRGTPEQVQAAINAGAKIDDRDPVGATPLMRAAAWNKNPDVITTLLNAGAKIDHKDIFGETPLMLAAFYNENPAVIMTLLNAGADPTIKSGDGKTALDYAQGNAKLKGTPALKALQDATLGSSGSTNKPVAQDIFALAKSGTPEQIQAAINAGAKLDDRDKDGWTPLMWAAGFNGNPEVITALLNAGARLDDRDNFGMTPLMNAAAGNQNPDVITTLLRAGAKIDDRNIIGWTPLMNAAV